MNAGTALVLLIVIVVVALALRSAFKKKESPCGHDCSSCSGCNAKVYGINTDADGAPMDCNNRPARK